MKISVIFGTRPEIIKLAILIQKLSKHSQIELDVCFTGQHKEMVLPLIDFFEIKIDSHLDLMEPNQTLATLTSNATKKLDGYFKEKKPDIAIVQGDTTTAMCSAMTAFYNNIKVAHVEAGLRTHNMHHPFPEEFNRCTISLITNYHYAPTTSAKNNLLGDNVSEDNILITGNTVIDALNFTLEKVENNQAYRYSANFNGKRIVLITGHRRENFESFDGICYAIKHLAEKYTNYAFVYPVHLNPNVQEPVNRILGNVEGVYLIPPADYISFVQLMNKAYVILTDSGGIQEEAPTLGKPVLVMRNTTERPEAVEAGTSKLIGTNKNDIVREVSTLLDDNDVYAKMSNQSNPYGDGKSTDYIIRHLEEQL